MMVWHPYVDTFVNLPRPTNRGEAPFITMLNNIKTSTLCAPRRHPKLTPIHDSNLVPWFYLMQTSLLSLVARVSATIPDSGSFLTAKSRRHELRFSGLHFYFHKISLNH